MVWFCSIICLSVGIFGFYRDRKIYSPLGFFATFWALLIFLSGMRLYDLYETSTFTYLIVTLGVICFGVGSFFSSLVKVPSSSKNGELNDRIYNILCIICVIALIYNIQIIMRFFASGFDIGAIYYEVARTASGEETSLAGLYPGWQEQLRQYIGYPLLYTIVPISISAYISTRRKKYLVVSILLSALRFLVDIRRTFLVIIVIIIACRLLIDSPKIRNLVKNYKLRISKRALVTTILMLVFGIGFIWLSTIRRAEGEDRYSFIQNFYFYYVGSLPYVSKMFESITISQYTFGLTSFRGLFAPIFGGLAIFGLGNQELMATATKNITMLHGSNLFVAPGHRFNSYATIFYQFYQEGGIWGVAIISIICGFNAHYQYKCMSVRFSERDKIKYAYFFSVFIMFSVLHFNGAVLVYLWPLILERFFYKRKVPLYNQ